MWKEERPFVNVCNSKIVSDEMFQNGLPARKAGEDAMTDFFTRFTIAGAEVTDPKRSK